MRKYLYLFFILLSSFLAADDPITDYLTSENDTLALVDGIVNAYNGKLVQIDKDIEISGSDPIELIRYYDSGHHFRGPLGYGIGISQPLLLTYNFITEKAFVEQRSGSFLPFKAVRKKENYIGRIDPKFLKSSYTNCCEGLIRGETDISAMNINGSLGAFVVDLGNGTKRHYTFIGMDEENTRHYRLVREERANGNIRHIEYIDIPRSGAPKRIWTTNGDNSLILNWINFYYDKNIRTIVSSNGENVHYLLESKEIKAKKSRLNYETYICNLIKKVSGKNILTTEYDTLSRTRCEESIYSINNITRPNGRSLKIDYDKKERVAKLTLKGIDRPLYTFNYQKNTTIVTDALNHTKRFEFNNRRLVKLAEPHRTQEYIWNDNGQLISHIFKDSNQNIISTKEYAYDAQGNILEAKVNGNICYCGSYEQCIVRKVYSQDGRNNLISENFNNLKEITYDYVPNTNLLARKLTYADNDFQEREFYEYDKNAIMIKKIVDDGNALECNNLMNVTYRHITEIEPQLNPELPGMTHPHCIKEWYVDPNSNEQRLLKMVEKIYTQGDLLLAERTYDSNGNYCYSNYFEYNDKKQLTGEINPYNHVTLYQYDENGNKTYEQKVDSGKKTQFFYDAANRLIKEIENHTNGRVLTTSHAYDAMSYKSAPQII